MADQWLENIRKNCSKDIKAYIVKYQINVNALIYSHSQLPLEIAVNACALESVRVLISFGADPNGIGYSTPLICCVRQDDSNLAQYLIDMGANTCQPDKYGKTPLLWAVLTGNVKMVDLLLKNGAEFTIHSALMEAANTRNCKIFQLLIEKSRDRRATLNLVDVNGDTIFLKAVRIANFSAVKYLIEQKIDLNQKNVKNNESALSICLKKSDFRTFQLLIDSGADPTLARVTIDEMAKQNPDFAAYVKSLKTEDNATAQTFKVECSGQEESPEQK